MTQSESIANLAAALCKAQAEMPSADKDGTNPHFRSKFATLANVMQTALPTLTKHGLSVTQFVSNMDGASALTTILMHASGEYIAATMPLLLVKNDPQGQGSAITYARRYGLMAAIGMVADEDDDGNAASQPAARTQNAPVEPFSRPTAPLQGPATDKQIATIKKMLGSRLELFEAAKKLKVDELTKAQASSIIEQLKAKEEEKEEPAFPDGEIDLNELPF